MKEYMFLMKGEKAPNASPEELQQRMQAYMVWMKKMLAEGRLKAGQPLEPAGTWLKDKNTVVTDGPYLEPKEIIGGYVIVLAHNLEEATDLAKECPLLDHCEIFVRPVFDVPTS